MGPMLTRRVRTDQRRSIAPGRITVSPRAGVASRRDRALVRRPWTPPLRRAAGLAGADLGPRPPAPRRRLPAARPQRARPRQLERRREPGRGGVRRRRPPRHVGGRQPPARPAGARAAAPRRAGRARRVRDRTRRAVDGVRPVARRARDRRRGDRRPGRAVGDHQLRRAPVAAVGRAADGGPAAAAVQRRDPGDAAAAAVHDVPVHQRRGVAGGRDVERHRLRRRARHLLRPRRGVRPFPHPLADARPEPVRELVRGRRSGRRDAGRRRALRARRRRPPSTRRQPAERPPAAQHRARDDLLPGHPGDARRARPHRLLRALRLPGHPGGDGGGVDDPRPHRGVRRRDGGRSHPRAQRAAGPGGRVPRRVHGDVLHGAAVDGRHLPGRVRRGCRAAAAPSARRPVRLPPSEGATT